MVGDLTTGSPLKKILLFCVPLFIGNVFQQFYNIVDSIIVGQFVGVNAFAAVGSTGSLNFFVIGFALGICSGFAVPVAQDFGAKDMASLRRSVAHGIVLSAIVAVVLTALMMVFTRQILALLRTPADIFEDSYNYIIVIFAGIGFTILYNMLSGLLRALGDSRTPLYFLIVASIINVILDYVLVALLRLGVAGAAYATIASQGISGLLCLWRIVRSVPLLHVRREDLRINKRDSFRLLGIGVPMGLQFSITAIGAIILTSAVNTLGSTVVASVSAAQKVQALVTTPMDSVGAAMTTYAGQNYGARKLGRVRQGVRTMTIVLLAYAVFAFGIDALFGRTIALMFIDSSETEILGNIHTFLVYNGAGFPVLILIHIFRQTLQGLGYSKASMAAGAAELIGRALTATVLVRLFGFTGVCCANGLAWLLADVVLIPLYIYAINKLKKQPEFALAA